ncbi:MAG: GNAT family N-acetyltransferase [Selenomonadaceae bacterium]|nr:GNAT family N-acetyltransferase [Selenomonadaceae bacterium]
MENENILIETKRLRIRRADLHDLQFIMDIQRVPENLKFIVPFDEKFHEKILSGTCADKMDVIVEERDGKNPVGYFLLSELDNPHNKVEFTQGIITKKNCGYGRESFKALLQWSFMTKKFHRVFLDCKEYNTVALHLYESLGFKREGIMRDVICTGGVYENLVLLGILENEFEI